MIQSIYDILRQRLLEYMRLARNKYSAAVRPIFGIRRRGVAPIHIGSCVLLSLRETRFLITAGHVTDHASSTRLHVSGSKELIPLSFDAGFTTNPTMPRDEDVYDFSVCALSSVMQRALGEVTYITEKDIYNTFPLGRNRVRMAMGYPTGSSLFRVGAGLFPPQS
jgi:hypothetical protein